jgi:hypothetical protein
LDPNIAVSWLLLLASTGYALVAPSLLRRRHAEGALPRWTSKVGLPIVSSPVSKLAFHMLTQRIGMEVGAALGVALAALWAIIVGRDTVGSTWWPIILLSGLLIGAAAGNAVGACRVARRPVDPHSRRVARSTVARLADHVPPLERRAARVVALVPALLLIVVVVFRPGSAVALPAVAAASSLAVWAAAEAGARAVLRGRQPAGSDLELAWQDVMRAQAVRSILAVPAAVGAYAGAAVLAAFEPGQLDPRGLGGLLLVAVSAVIVGAGIGLSVWTNSPRPYQHVLGQLWPGDGPTLAGVPGKAR